MSYSGQPHRRQPTTVPHPWSPSGKNTGVGCHFLLHCMKVKSEREVAQRCLTPWTAAYQAPPSMDFPGKSTGVGCHCLLRVSRVSCSTNYLASNVIYPLLSDQFCIIMDCRRITTLSSHKIYRCIFSMNFLTHSTEQSNGKYLGCYNE